MADATLGKLLTTSVTPRTSRLTAITENTAMSLSVSRRCLLRSIEQGNLWERDVDQSIGFGVTRNTYSAHSKFSENIQAEKVVDRSGKLEEQEQLKCTD